MPFLHTAGSDLWIGNHRVGHRVTNFRTKNMTTIAEITGISQRRRHRADAGVRDAGFELAGLVDTGVLDTLKGSGGDIVFAEGREEGVSRVIRFQGRIQEEDSVESPVGDFVRCAASGYMNTAPQIGRLMVYRKHVGSVPNSSHSENFYASGNDDVQWDLGSAWMTSTHSVSLAVHIESENETDVTLSNIIPYGATNLVAWAEIGTGLRINLHSHANTPIMAKKTANGSVRRFMGIRLQTNGTSASAALDARFSVFAFIND